MQIILLVKSIYILIYHINIIHYPIKLNLDLYYVYKINNIY